MEMTIRPICCFGIFSCKVRKIAPEIWYNKIIKRENQGEAYETYRDL